MSVAVKFQKKINLHHSTLQADIELLRKAVFFVPQIMGLVLFRFMLFPIILVLLPLRIAQRLFCRRGGGTVGPDRQSLEISHNICSKWDWEVFHDSNEWFDRGELESYPVWLCFGSVVPSNGVYRNGFSSFLIHYTSSVSHDLMLCIFLL